MEEVKQVLEEAAQTAAPPEPKNPIAHLPSEEQAAIVFGQGLPEFKRLVDAMTMKQLKRVMKALAEAPLNKAKFQFTLPIEADTFKLGMALMNAKFVMFEAVAAEQIQNQRKQVAEQAMNKDNNKEEVKTNG